MGKDLASHLTVEAQNGGEVLQRKNAALADKVDQLEVKAQSLERRNSDQADALEKAWRGGHQAKNDAQVHAIGILQRKNAALADKVDQLETKAQSFERRNSDQADALAKAWEQVADRVSNWRIGLQES